MSEPNDRSYWEPAREIERLTVQICELRAEIERLRQHHRAILELWEKGIAAPIGAISRRALEGK